VAVVVVLIKQQEILQVVLAVVVLAEAPIRQTELLEMQILAVAVAVGGKVQREMAEQAAPALSSLPILPSIPTSQLAQVLPIPAAHHLDQVSRSIHSQQALGR
jgi:hypothetical protein